MSTFDFFPFESGDGAFITEPRWSDMFTWMRTVGVLSEDTTLAPDGELAVNPADPSTGTQVQVEDGEAFIQGFMFIQTDGPEVIGIPLNESGDPRIDLLVLRLDKENDIIEYVDIEGDPDPSPVAPDPIQNSTIWDLPLAEIYVADGATTITSMDITDVRVRSLQGDGGSSAVTLDSAGLGESLVAQGVGPNIENKSLVEGANISLTSDADTVTITATGAGSDVTLASAGGTQTLVATGGGVGPNLQSKGLSSSTGISLSSDASSVTITNSDPASGVTLTNAGSGSTLVNDGSGPSLAVKSLTASTNINFTVSGTDIAIAGAPVPSDSPICIVRRTSDVTIATGATDTITWQSAIYDPYSMWDGATTITVPSTGWYQIILNMRFSGDVAANGSVLIRVTDATDTSNTGVKTLAAGMSVGNETILLNSVAIVYLTASTGLISRATQNTGVIRTIQSTGTYTPTMSVWKIRI